MEREDYMRAALALAHAAAADGEVPVGCVIADDAGRIIVNSAGIDFGRKTDQARAAVMMDIW